MSASEADPTPPSLEEAVELLRRHMDYPHTVVEQADIERQTVALLARYDSTRSLPSHEVPVKHAIHDDTRVWCGPGRSDVACVPSWDDATCMACLNAGVDAGHDYPRGARERLQKRLTAEARPSPGVSERDRALQDALTAMADVEVVEAPRHLASHAQLGDAPETKRALIRAVRALYPPPQPLAPPGKLPKEGE